MPTVYRGQLDGDLLRRLNISEIFVADPTLSPQRISEIAELSWQNAAPALFRGFGARRRLRQTSEFPDDGRSLCVVVYRSG